MSEAEVDHQTFLETFFRHIGKFSFDKAKEMAEKEKEARKSEVGSSWMLIVTSLYQFSLAERTYMSLTFLSQKWFSRPKENPRNAYTSLTHEFKKATETDSHTSRERILSHICGQMCDFLTARHKLMDFYEQMLTMSTNRNADYADLLSVISEIIHVHNNDFHHPILGALKTSFTYECDILLHLLQAHKNISSWQFLPSLLQLHEAHGKLATWGAPGQSITVRRTFSMSGSKVSAYPPLYVWLSKFKSCLLSKFGLYFIEVLSKQTTLSEMKTISARSTEDFMSKIIGLHKKCDAHNTTIILEVDDTDRSDNKYEGSGYCHPLRELDTPQGINCYKSIVSYPSEKPQKLWPQIVMMISSNVSSDFNKIHYVYDETQQTTFYLCQIEHLVWIVIIFLSKKSEKDTHVYNFLSDFVSQLRLTKLLSNLKPGVK